MQIKLDITGFYYSKTFTGEQYEMVEGKSVEFLTRAAEGMLGDNDRGRLTQATFSDRGFLSSLTVDFTPQQSPEGPVSRQVGGPAGAMPPPRGVYGYADCLSNVVSGANISFTPVWQYYLFDGDGVLKSKGSRVIVPAADSEPLVDGDTVVWRVVLIGGLHERTVLGAAQNQELAAQVYAEGSTSIEAMTRLTQNLTAE